MNKFKIPITADLFFTFIASFCLFYAIFIKNGWGFIASTLFAILCALIVSTIVLTLLVKFFEKKGLGVYEQKLKANLTNYLTFLPRSKLLNYFVNSFKNGGLYLEIFNDGLLLKNEKIFIYPIFLGDEISKQNIVKAYNKKGENKLIILTESYSNSVLSFADSVNVTLYDINSVYLTLKEYNALPEFNEFILNKRKRLIETLKGLFNKKYAKIFFISGIVTLLSSTITFFKTYYIVVGGILLTLSAVCKFFAPITTESKIIKLK